MTEPKKRPGAVQAPPLLPHPLFEPEEPGEEPAIVYRIKVTRWGPRGQRWVPQQFEAATLVSLQQIQETYGGGDYELIAYGPGGCVGRRRYSLDGRSRPLYADDDDADPGPGFGAAAPAPPPAPSGGGGASDWMPLLIAMMKTSSDSQATMFAGMMQMVGGMISGSRDAAAGQVAQMQQLSSAHAAQQAALLTAIVESKGGGGASAAGSALVEMLKEGIELGRTRAGGGDGDGESDGIESIISAAAPFIMGAMGAAGQGQGAPGVLPASVAPPTDEPDPETQ
jgi:hypothetical protein